MDLREPLCICPPSPKLEEKIVRSKQRILARESLPSRGTDDLLDNRTFTLIASRPKRTRPDTFISPVRDAVSVTGQKKVIVILIDFPDCPATRDPSDIYNLFFSNGTYPNGSMRDYYREVSYNILDIDGEVKGWSSGWYRAPHPKTYYSNGNYGFGDNPPNAQELVEDAINLADPDINFDIYDDDNDGIVDNLVVIAAGSGAEETGNVDDLWSHKWAIPTKTVDNVKVQRYFMAPEDGRVGVMSHEFGHLLCKWPDLYDTDYSSKGTGRWDLMAGGNWNGNGDRPAHPVAWCKLRAGWVNPITIFNSEQSVTIQPFNAQGQVYKLPIGSLNSKEYLLLSNRQKAGFDDQLPGEGLIIEHVDDSISSNTDENHYLVDIEQGDGARHLNINANPGDANDPFPSGANNELTPSSVPSSNPYTGAVSDIYITNIQRSGANITVNIKNGAAGCWLWRWITGLFK